MQLALFQSLENRNIDLPPTGCVKKFILGSRPLRAEIGRSTLRSLAWLMAMLTLVLGGCTTSPRLSVDIDAINSGQPVQDVRYVLKPVVKGVDESDLHFIEYSRHIDNALQQRGMTKADAPAQANVEIEVNYGYKRYQRAVRRHSVFDDPFYHERRCRHWHKGRCVQWYPYRSFDWWYDRPAHHVDVITGYRVFVVLEAKRIGAAEGEPSLWTTRAWARFSKPDLRVTLPLLLVAAEEYIGVDTGHERTVVLTGDELSVELPQGDLQKSDSQKSDSQKSAAPEQQE